MKLSSGKRIGQSGRELAAAAFFSFFLHGILLAAALLYLHATPKTHLPPFYDVKLVGQPAAPAELPQTPPRAGQPAPSKQVAKASPKKGKKSAPKAYKAQAKKSVLPKVFKAQANKGALPELAKPQQKPAEMAREQPPQPAGGTPSGATGTGAKGENVEVTASQQNFKDAWYLLLVRDKIGQNWRPPPDAKDAKVRVIFTINRSGWTSPSDVNIDEKNSTGTYGFKLAAVRAILSSKPFPQLPDDFPKQTLELSVDLMAE